MTPDEAVFQPKPRLTSTEIQTWYAQISSKLAAWTHHEQVYGKVFHPVREGETPMWGSVTPNEMEEIARPIREDGWAVEIVEGYLMDVGPLGIYELHVYTQQRMAQILSEERLEQKRSRRVKIILLGLGLALCLILFGPLSC